MVGLRGESVGSAYVRIYADGSEVPGDIRRMLDEAEPSVRKAGRDHGEAYGEELSGAVDKSFRTHFDKTKGEMFDDLNQSFTDSVSKLEVGDRFFEGREWDRFLKRVDKKFGDAGVLAAKDLEKAFRDTADFDALLSGIDRIGVLARKRQGAILDATFRDQEERIKSHLDYISARDEAFTEHSIRLTRERDAVFEQSVKNNQRNAQAFGDNLDAIIEHIDRLTKGDKAIGRGRLGDMIADLQRLAPSIGLTDHEMIQFNDTIDRQNKRLRESTPLLSSFDRLLDRISDKVAVGFGKGSRNDFLNFFGRFVGFLVAIPRLIPNALSWITRLGRTMHFAFDEVIREGGSGARAFLAGITAGIEALGGALATGLAGIAALIALVGILGLVLGPVVSIASGLLGIVTALAGSLAFAGASLLSFAPLIAPIAAIIGGTILMISKFKKDSGELGDVFDDLKTRAKRWVDVFSDQAFKRVDDYADRVDKAFHGFGPLFDAAGRGFNQFLNQITKGLDSSGFDHFVTRLTQFLPHAMSDLGDILSNIGGGLGGVFTALIPSANRLLGWLTKITQQFSDWANTRQGRRDIKDFMEKAGDSAEALGGFLMDAWGWLKKLLTAGRGTGDDILTRMGDKFLKWGTWLDDHRDSLKDWFGNAEDTAHEIGNTIDKLNHFLALLDSPQSRELAKGLFATLNGFLIVTGESIMLVDSGIAGLIHGIEALWSGGGQGIGLKGFFDRIGQVFWYVVGGQWADDLIAGIGDGLRAAGEQVKGAVHDLLNIFSGGGSGGLGAMSIKPNFDSSLIIKGVTKLPGEISKAIDGIPHLFHKVFDRIPGVASGTVGDIIARFSNLPSRAASAIAGIRGQVSGVLDRLPPLASSTVNKMRNYFSDLPNKVSTALSDLGTKILGKFTAAVTLVSLIPGQIVALFLGLGQRIVNAIGTITIPLSSFNLPDIPYLPDPLASGGLIRSPRFALVGEAGPEAVVPLNRPLSQVDPAVRALSAIAQGLRVPGMASGGVVGRTLDLSGWTIVTPTSDSRAVASEMLNTIVAQLSN